VVVEFTQLDTVLDGRVEGVAGFGVDGAAAREDIVGDDDAVLGKESALHDHIVDFGVLFLLGINEDDIEWPVKGGNSTIRWR